MQQCAARLSIVVIAALVLAGALPTSARADDVTLTVKGSADVGDADPRVAALDEAFAKATRDVLGDLVDRDERERRRADLDREIVARARLWVTSFRVAKDTTSGNRRTLDVTVKINRDKVAARLLELSIAVIDPAVGPSVGPGVGPGIGAGEPASGAGGSGTALVLVRVTTPDGTRLWTGDDAEASPLADAARALGLAPVFATTAMAADDASARAAAEAVGADWALIVDARATAAEAVRGLRSVGSFGSATIRLLGREGNLAASAKAIGGAYREGEGTRPRDLPTEAALDAAALAVREVSAVVRPAVAAPKPSPGQVLVQVSVAAGAWHGLAALRTELEARKATVSLRRLAPTGVTFSIGGLASAAVVARTLRALDGQLRGASVRVRVGGVGVEVTLGSGTP